MTAEIPAVFLRRLIAIGESQDFPALQQLFAEFPAESMGHFMRQSPEFWHSIADSISNTELEALIRALTVAERDFPAFGGGSVSGVIWTFHRLQQRTKTELDALADWILAHTGNGWAPFGRSNLGARSLAELEALRHRVAARRVANQVEEKERHSLAAKRKAEKATHDMFAAIRRKDMEAIQALLIRGARLDVQNTQGVTALAYAQALGHAKVLELLQNNTKGPQGKT